MHPRDSAVSIDRDDGSNLIVSILNAVSPILSALAWYVNIKLLVKSAFDVLDLKSFALKSSSTPSHLLPYLKENCTLTPYELEIAESVITPAAINSTYDSIGGAEDVKIALWECVGDFISSRRRKQSSSILNSVRGVLLFGPPGCGKTLLVFATAKMANLPIINISPSTLFRKYIGDTNQLLKAVFTLSEKLQPCILMIDEMDALFRARYESEHSIDREVKTEFMQLWDALVDRKDAVLVLGASNMPELLDHAIQRRFERSFLIGLPNKKSRANILKILLSGCNLDSSFDFRHISELTEGYSPSDMLALCKAAIQISKRHSNLDENGSTNYVGNLTATVDNNLQDAEMIQTVVCFDYLFLLFKVFLYDVCPRITGF
jgi:SpoVK/Ycf46/Vps4 family AAA+-type ATPase